ncbi:MAG: DUF2961 domain-containing protein, partial [Fermentimonas sp.]|nr:DUF2961 domain-containing protein [Fermentimonas sp.]
MDSKKEINRQSRRKALMTLAAVAGTSALGVVGNNLYSKNEDQILNSDTLPLFSIRNMKSGQLTTFNNETKQKAFPIQPGERKILVQHDSPGIISRIWMTISGWFWENWDVREEKWPDTTILKKLILRIYWDDNKFPSVEAPFGDFFGVGHCEYKHFVSKYIGMSSGGFYCYLPMPFNKVKIEVENLHDKSIPHVFLNANYTSYEVLPSDAGRFHCMYNSGTNAGSEPQYILKTRGKGHFVGCCVSMQSWLPNYLGYLEAPEYIFIDDDFEEKTPVIVGTGLEDYFNGGWYFRDGEFNAPLHGVPLKDPLRSMISMYRFHETDPIFFDKSFVMMFQSPRPPEHTREFKYSSTAYWYQQSASELLFKLPNKDKLVDLYRIRDT